MAHRGAVPPEPMTHIHRNLRSGVRCRSIRIVCFRDGDPDWPFESLKLGEYFALARRSARRVRERQEDIVDAVNAVLGERVVTDVERRMLIEKCQSIVYLGQDDSFVS